MTLSNENCKPAGTTRLSAMEPGDYFTFRDAPDAPLCELGCFNGIWARYVCQGQGGEILSDMPVYKVKP